MWLCYALCARTQIQNCYTTDSYLIYSQDMRQMHLYLSPSNNTECRKFPNGVQFNLTLGMAAANQHTAVTRTFNYDTTREIVFDGVTSLASCSSAYIRVFDYGFYTDLEVFTIQQQMSNLERCFSDIVFRTLKEHVELDFVPTGECSNIFDQNAGILYGASVVIDNEEYDLDIADFLGNYAAGAMFRVTKRGVDKQRLYSPFLSSFMQFEITIYGLNMKFSVSISNYDGQLVQGIIPEALLGQWEQRFFVKAVPDYNADIGRFLYIVGTYDEVDCRISFRRNDVLFKYVLSFPGQIDNSRAIYQFDCLEIASPAESQVCLDFYAALLRGERFEMVLDIIFKLNQEFVVKYYQTLSPVESCWSRMIYQVGSTEYCAVVEWTDSCPKGVAGTLAITRVGNATTGIIANVVSATLPHVSLTPQQTTVCVPIGDNTWLRETHGSYIEFKVTVNGKDYYALSQTVTRGNYQPTLYAAVAFGGLLIVYCLYSSIHGVITTMKSIRKIKVNKKYV